jgi:tetratricopeptide (TPR) repeat protein
MGAFFGSVQIRSDDREKIKVAAERVAAAMKINLLIGPAQNGWTGVYPEQSGQDERVGAELAKLFDGYVMHILLHDDDVFAYWLHRDGKLIDSYWSTPGYFGAKNRAAELKMAGQPELFRPIIGDKVEQLAKTLDRSEPRPVFMSEKLEAFAELLEIPHAMQSYEYILEGEMLDPGEQEQFEQISGGDDRREADDEPPLTSNDPADLIARIDDPAKKHLHSGLMKMHNDWAAAIEEFNRAIEIRPDFAQAFNFRGVAKLKGEDLDGALADLNSAIKLDPDSAGSLRVRGDIRRRKNDLAGALADYNQSLEFDPDDPTTLNNRGFTKKKLGDLAGALADFDEAIYIDPGDPSFYKNRGDVKRALKDFKSAIPDYDAAIELRPKNAISFNSRGLCKSALGDLDGAMADYDLALALDPKPADQAAITKNRENVMRRKNTAGAPAPKIELDAAIHYAVDQANHLSDPLQLPEPLRTVFLVQGAQGIIDNGGLQYFFGRDWEGQPPYSIFVDAYRTIGAKAEADALAAAIASFPFSDPHKDQDRRREFMDQFLLKADGTRHRPDSPFERYDICGSDTVWRLLADYVQAHAGLFSS